MTTTNLPARSKFGWCNDGKHEACRRTRIGFGVNAGVTRHCGCTESGCPCAVYNQENPDEDQHA